MDIQVADMVFQSVPDETDDAIHLAFIKKMLERFSKDLLMHRGYKDEGKVDHRLQSRFLRKYARFLLHRKPDSIEAWLHAFLHPFIPSEHMASFISDVVS